MFPTLKEVFETTNENLAFDIEIKYPLDLEVGLQFSFKNKNNQMVTTNLLSVFILTLDRMVIMKLMRLSNGWIVINTLTSYSMNYYQIARSTSVVPYSRHSTHTYVPCKHTFNTF
jgi:hypothetical protein